MVLCTIFVVICNNDALTHRFSFFFPRSYTIAHRSIDHHTTSRRFFVLYAPTHQHKIGTMVSAKVFYGQYYIMLRTFMHPIRKRTMKRRWLLLLLESLPLLKMVDNFQNCAVTMFNKVRSMVDVDVKRNYGARTIK
jgi:hypothetical protein